MEKTWFIFEDENGINDVFNKNKKHKGDDALVPFKTKNDNNQYEDFSGVVGAFSRIISDNPAKKKLDIEELKRRMYEKMDDCTDENFEKLFYIIEDIYFVNKKLLPINVKALSYIDCNITQQQVAEYIYSLFVEESNLKEAYKKMQDSEDTNILEMLVFDSLDENQNDNASNIAPANCFLPYVKKVFVRDFETLIKDTKLYQDNITRFLAYYYMFYVTQLAVKLNKFEKGDKNEIENIFLTLHEEVVTRVRPGYEYGWKYVKDKMSNMFSHSVVMELLSHNKDSVHTDYIGFYELFNNSEHDSQVAEEIVNIRKLYQEWIPLDYSGCKYSENQDTLCKVSVEIKKLFETIDYQFINGGRKSHYNGYNKKFINFIQKNFGKFRGMYGYTLSVYDSDIIMFTRIILNEYSGRIKLTKLFEEFEKRGLLFDRESKKRIVELFEKMNLLEKRSDSGDAQYVKYIL